VASVWGLIALKLADDEIIPFNYVNYASELEVPVFSLDIYNLIHIVKKIGVYECLAHVNCRTNYRNMLEMLQIYVRDVLSLSPLHKSIRQLESAATKIHHEKKVKFHTSV
jgi:N-acetylated-alpha-linked acidic dipeptidase